MKTIYVTIHEFQANGGVLKPNRPIYIRDGLNYISSTFWPKVDKNYAFHYVEIEAMPIYI